MELGQILAQILQAQQQGQRAPNPGNSPIRAKPFQVPGQPQPAPAPTGEPPMDQADPTMQRMLPWTRGFGFGGMATPWAGREEQMANNPIMNMLQGLKPTPPTTPVAGNPNGQMGPMWQRPGFGGLGGSFGQFGQPNQGAAPAAMQGLRERGMFGLGGRR